MVDVVLELKVIEALPEDVGKGLARLDPEDIKALNGVLGDVIEISGTKNTVARITGTLPEHVWKKVIQIDGITRSNAKCNLGEVVRIKRISRKTAMTVIVTPLDFSAVLPDQSELDQFAKVLQGLTVVAGDKINIPFLAGKDRFFQVEATSPLGGVIINQKTKFILKKPDFSRKHLPMSLTRMSEVSSVNSGSFGRWLNFPCGTQRSLKNWGLRRPKVCFSMDLRAPVKP